MTSLQQASEQITAAIREAFEDGKRFERELANVHAASCMSAEEIAKLRAEVDELTLQVEAVRKLCDAAEQQDGWKHVLWVFDIFRAALDKAVQ